jgi:hypothetical protein
MVTADSVGGMRVHSLKNSEHILFFALLVSLLSRVIHCIHGNAAEEILQVHKLLEVCQHFQIRLFPEVVDSEIIGTR